MPHVERRASDPRFFGHTFQSPYNVNGLYLSHSPLSSRCRFPPLLLYVVGATPLLCVSSIVFEAIQRYLACSARPFLYLLVTWALLTTPPLPHVRNIVNKATASKIIIQPLHKLRLTDKATGSYTSLIRFAHPLESFHRTISRTTLYNRLAGDENYSQKHNILPHAALPFAAFI